MMRAWPTAVLVCAAACSQRGGEGTVPRELPDSIVLERTSCLGMCPVYHLSVTKGGRVAFQEDATDVSDTTSAAAFSKLSDAFETVGFSSLPDKIQDQAGLCMPVATDFPTVILTVFTKDGMKTVNDYHGCFGTNGSTKEVLRRLRLLEDHVDSVAHAARWIKPSPMR
jgi:hypothetical protein